MSLKIQESYDDKNNELILNPIGEIDIYTSEQFKNTLLDNISKVKDKLIINCNSLEFIDSTGLGALVYVLKESQENNKEIILRSVKPNIKKLLFLTKLDEVFKIED